MDKKKLLKQLLIKVKPYRNMAEGVLLLLEGNKLDNAMIDYLLYFLHKVTQKIETKGNISESIQSMYTKELEEKNMLYKLKQQILAK